MQIKSFLQERIMQSLSYSISHNSSKKLQKKIATREKENQNEQICSDLRGVSWLDSITDCRLQTDGNLKSMCEVKNKKNDRNTNKAKKVKSTIRKKNTIISSSGEKTVKEDFSPKTIKNNKSLVKKNTKT